MKSGWTLFLLLGFLLVLSGCEKLGNHAPIANFTASEILGDRPLNVTFDASLSFDEDNDMLSFLWDLGDGNVSSGMICTHTFNESGAFTVKLTVSDEKGLEDQASLVIQVDEPPDIFPLSGEAQWVYHVSSTKMENGVVKGTESGTMYLVASEYRKEGETTYMTLRVTGKKRYFYNYLGDYIYLIHTPGDGLKVSRDKTEDAKYMINYKESTWSGYCMFFYGPSTQEMELGTSLVEFDLGEFQAYKLRFHTDNWGESYVTERIDLTEAEYISPDIGLLYRETSSYVDMLDCSYCPVYTRNSEMILEGYYIKQTNGSVSEGGSGYNPNNQYGGDLGLRTIFATQEIGGTSVYLDGDFVGYFDNYFPGGVSCDQEDALNVYRPGGTYLLTAESSMGYYWEGDIDFTEGACLMLELTLSSKKGADGKAEGILAE